MRLVRAVTAAEGRADLRVEVWDLSFLGFGEPGFQHLAVADVDHAAVGVEGADQQQVVGIGQHALGCRVAGQVPVGGVEDPVGVGLDVDGARLVVLVVDEQPVGVIDAWAADDPRARPDLRERGELGHVHVKVHGAVLHLGVVDVVGDWLTGLAV